MKFTDRSQNAVQPLHYDKVCSHLNDAAQELTGNSERPFVAECRMAAVSSTVQPADKSKVWSPQKTQQNKAPAPEQVLGIEALGSILLEVGSKTCCSLTATLQTTPAVLS